MVVAMSSVVDYHFVTIPVQTIEVTYIVCDYVYSLMLYRIEFLVYCSCSVMTM